MEARRIDIVVGTQLVTKGYHFPNLTLVGRGRCRSRPCRAATFAPPSAASSRSPGRGPRRARREAGPGLVQTHEPDAPVIAALVTGDSAGFYAAETEARREAAMPPFGRLAGIIVSSEDLAEAAPTPRARSPAPRPRVERMAVFGPAPAPLAMLRGRHRQRLLVHAARALDVQDVIRDWLGALEWHAKVRVTVDVDPYSFL